MPLDQFLIAPMIEGLQTDVSPWLLPEQAFAKLQNAYVWRGRVRKRFGSTFIPNSNAVEGFEQLNSRLRINIGNTDGSGDIDWTVSPIPGIIWKVGQMFSIGTDLFTVVSAGSANMITNSSTATVFTYDTTNGHYTITGADVGGAVTACYFYPAEPVMGLLNYELGAINDEPTYAFDTQFSYSYTAAGWVRIGTSPTGLWAGSNSQFFWGENYRGDASENTWLFVTNNNPVDNVRYWNGAAWINYTPAYTTTATDTIEGCRVIISFKSRIIFLNTWESVGAAPAVNHVNRIRYSQDGSLFQADAWYEGEYTSGKGGYVDASTKEAIVSARILRDRLIIFFERSTWELVYTGNESKPFIFQRINSELGAESTFSTVLFDKVLLGVGNVGIHACNGANVDRIDQNIPSEVFRIHNGNDGVERVYGIRDYYAEMVYWSIPSQGNGITSHGGDPIYPTQVIAYNYKNKTWGKFDDSITCFGYLQNLDDETWQMDDQEWQHDDSEWNSGTTQSEFRQVIAGNQEGYTFIVDIDSSRNAPSLQITQLSNASGLVTVTAVDHNFINGEYVLIENVLGATDLSGMYEILTTPTTATFTINEPDFAGTYTGGGTVTRVSQIDIRTKEYNFYQKQGRNLYIPKVGFYVSRTPNGQIATDYFTSSSPISMIGEGIDSTAIIGTGILETTPYPDVTLENFQERFWHIIYPQAEGETIQIRLYLNEDQMLDEDIALSDFVLNAINIYSQQIHRY